MAQMTIQEIEDAARAWPATEHEDRATRRHFASTGRYVVDFAPGFTSSSWVQFDTPDDAAYFGLWVDPVRWLTLCYTEGDWTFCEFSSAEAYNARIRALCEFHEPTRYALAIDKDGATAYYQDRVELFAREGAE